MDKEKLDNYQLPKGYKNTEIGVIPDDWEVNKFGDILEKIVGGGTPSRSNGEFWGNEIPWVTVKDFTTFNPYSTQEYITKKGLNNSASHLIPKNTLITSTRMGLGKAVIYYVDVTINQDLKAIFPLKKLNTKFLYYWFQKNSAFIENLGSGSTVMGISLVELKNIRFVLPPLPEQTAIASVLSDTDSLIQALEKKIAKKQLIKKGAMQNLLTPKEGWEVRTLGDFLIYEQPTKYIVESTEYNDNYDMPVLTAGKTFVLGYTNELNGIFKNHPVIIFDDFTTASKYVDFSFKVKSSAMKILKPKSENVNLRFIFEIMQQIDFPLGDHKRHWIGEFQSLEITVPKSKEEQSKIAQILSDMDSEIEILGKKLAKYKQLKQGLMQNLLTGKIRLV
ncbi:MAG: restriction endonuclease subunit S [Bacteroidales bacterium]|nr:restriction endonuclease subunit S [Bacteroidales bacterium]